MESVDDGEEECQVIKKALRSLMSGFFFDIHQSVDVPRVQDDGFLTDDIGTEAQAVPCMSVMQIVRCANGDIVDVDAFLQEFSIMSFPSFKLGPGESARSHSADEFICLSEIEDAVEKYIRLLDGASL